MRTKDAAFIALVCFLMMMDRNLILEQTQPDTCNNSLHFHTARYFHILILQNIGQKVTVCNKYSHQNVHQAKNFYISVLFSPEDRRTQVENSCKTEKTSASYSSGFCKIDTHNRRGLNRYIYVV